MNVVGGHIQWDLTFLGMYSRASRFGVDGLRHGGGAFRCRVGV